MKCPTCEIYLAWDWFEDECIEQNELFDCPRCSITFRYEVDEGTYLGAQNVTVEVVDE